MLSFRLRESGTECTLVRGFVRKAKARELKRKIDDLSARDFAIV
jgi:hypothetical protein